MAELPSDDLRTCPDCSAVVAPSADHCWFCRREFGEATQAFAPADAAKAPPAAEVASDQTADAAAEAPADLAQKSSATSAPFAGVRASTKPHRPLQFGIGSLLVLTTVTAVCCALIATLGGWGVVLVIVAVPGLVTTMLAALRMHAEDTPMTFDQMGSLFIRSATLTIAGIVLWAIMFFGGAFAMCTLSVLGPGSAGVASGLIFLATVALLSLIGTILIMKRLWPRR